MLFFSSNSLSTIWIIGLATVLAVVAYAIYWNELRHRRVSRFNHIVLPVLRSIAVWLTTVMLLQPSLAMRHVQGKPSQLLIAIDDSLSMSRKDGGQESRFDIAARLLFGPNRSALQALGDQFNVRVVKTNGVRETTLWSSDSAQVTKAELPSADQVATTNSESAEQAFAPKSALGSIIQENPNSAILMLTDGVTTEGDSIAVAAKARSQSQPPLFFLGIGAESGLEDSKVISVSAPEQLDQLDSMSGEIKFDVDPSQPARVTIKFQDKVVWEKDLTDDERRSQSVLFSFPIKDLLPSESQSITDPLAAVQRSTLLSFDASIVQGENDAEIRNNTCSFQSWISLLRSRVLIVDSRSRWETRYIRNALDRDPTWQVDAISTSEPDEQQRFLSITQNPEQLAEYDLLILGELSQNAIPKETQEAIEKLVSQNGSGLIVIDSNYDYFQDDSLGILNDLLPIEFRDTDSSADSLTIAYRAQLAEAAKSMPAFLLTDSDNKSASLDWTSLTPFYVQSLVVPKPAATLLLRGIHDASNSTVPVFVEMRVGGGYVFYSSSDQTWKWRFKKADAVHRRLWAQICRSYARKPFLVQSDALKIDVAAKLFKESEQIPVRAALSSEQFGSTKDRLVYVLLKNLENGSVARFQLQNEPDLPSRYIGTLPPQPPGQYTVSIETAGMSALQQSLVASLVVAGHSRNELLATYQDKPAMEESATLTGGAYQGPANYQQLLDELQKISTGRVIRSEFALWKSYWWFVPLVCILGFEWLLRKRAGLI